MDANNNRNKTNNDKSNNNEIPAVDCWNRGSASVNWCRESKTGKSGHITDPGPTDKHMDSANPDISCRHPPMRAAC